MKAKGLSRRLLRMGLVLVLAITLVGMSLTPALASPRWGPADNEETGGHGHQHDGDHGDKDDGDQGDGQFSDLDEAPWAADIIEKIFKKGFIKGVDSEHFKPNKPVTNVEAAIMITRLLGLEDKALQSLQGTLPFLDADEVPSWARGYVDLMVAQGIMNGIETGHGQALQGMKPATRLEVTVMLIRALGLEEQAKANTGATLTFTDLAAIPPSLLGYVALAVEKGIVTGANNAFQPNKPVTRAEMAAMLDRASGKVTPSNTVSGTIVSVATVGEPSITVKKADNTQVTITLVANATVTLNGAASTLAGLQANDSVTLTLGTDGKATAVAATRGSVVTGTLVSAVTTGTLSITVKKADNTQVTVVLADNATVTLNGAASTVANLLANDSITATLGADGKATAVVATRSTSTVTGKLVSATTVGTLSVTLKKADNTQVTYVLTASATVTLNGAASTLANLQANDDLTLSIGTDGKATAVVATRTANTVSGQLVSASTIGTLSITVKKADNTQATYELAANATVTLNGAASTLANLQLNDDVTLTLGTDGKATAVAATRGLVSGKLVSATTIGTLSITIKKADNTQATYELAANATVTLNGAASALANLQVNDDVTLTLNTDGKAAAVAALRATTVTGSVYSVGSGMIAVKKADNTVTSYAVAAGASIKLNDATATLDQLQANDLVTVTVGTDGKVSAIVATRTDPALANMQLTVSTNKTAFPLGEAVNFTFTVKNNNTAPVTIIFPTAQQYDLIVTLNNSAVWQWSLGQAFGQTVTEMTLAAGQTVTYAATWGQLSSAAQAVAAGQYAIKAQFKGKINNQALPEQTGSFTIQ